MRIGVKEKDTFLTEVYVADFGDNYHRLSDEPSSELEKAARKIRRRYKNMHDYLNAVAIYNEYMAYMMLRHGGPQLFKIKLKNDMIEEFIPAKPRMKNTLGNRMLLKRKIVLSRTNNEKINENVVQELTEVYSEDRPETALILDTKSFDYVGRKLLRDESFNINTKKLKSITNINYLEEYFQTKNIIAKKEKEEKVAQYSLTDIVNGKAEQALQDTTEQDDIVFYRGNYLKREAMDELKVYHDLNDLGWNSLKIMKQKGVSKKITSVIKNQNKKNKKSKKSKNKKNRDADDFMMKVMVDNDHDTFEDFQKDMLNFSSENIFGR